MKAPPKDPLARHLLSELYERKFIGVDETIILCSGLEIAFMGVTSTSPRKAIYDYWVCVELLINRNKKDWDSEKGDIFKATIKFLDEYYCTHPNLVSENNPLFIKTLNPNINYQY